MITGVWLEIKDDLDDKNITDYVLPAWRISPHFSRNMTKYLNEQFHDPWIGRDGPQNWPPRSPEFISLRFSYIGLHDKYNVGKQSRQEIEISSNFHCLTMRELTCCKT
jgi:hypothetical protein